MKQPSARVETVRDTYWGTTIADPYRWMEQTSNDELEVWLTEQGKYTRTYLDALPQYEQLLARVHALRQTTPHLFDLKVAGGHIFYRRVVPESDHALLYTRRLPDGPEQVVYDANESSQYMNQPLQWYVPSPDGRQVLCNIGSEQPRLCLLSIDRGELRDLGIVDVGYEDGSSRGNPCWLPDGTAFVYPRFGSMWLHRLEDVAEQEINVWGRGTSHVQIGDSDQAFIGLSPTSNWMLGIIFHGDLHECSIYAAPIASLYGDPSMIPWAKVTGIEHGVVGYALHGDTVFLRSHVNAPRYHILATTLHQPDISTSRIVVHAGTAVIQGMLVAGDYLLLQDLDGGTGRLRRVPLIGGQPEIIELPFDGSIDLFNNWNSMPFANDANGPDVFFMLQSWTIAPRLCWYDATLGNVVDTMWQPPSPFEDSTLVATHVFAPAHDGTNIPLWLIHRADLPGDTEHPTILYTYGSYGLAMSPYFWVEMNAWYERGGVLAIAGVRGGGEYGREWHEAGMLLNKANTINDFTACADYLIACGHTQPHLLAALGISAGSYPVGGALVRRPDLWSAIILNVGEPNTIRKEQHAQGNIPEIGTVTTEEGFAALLVTDSYGRVEKGTAYPAVMLTTGGRDIVVPSWQAAKMAARLQAATASDKPILLRYEETMGHVPETEQQWAEIHADMFAFLLDQLGR